jgi:hypothetical protein
MKGEWTIAGPTTVTLGDDSVKWSMLLEQLGGQGVEQVDQLAFAANVARVMRGNLAGECVFTSAKSYSTLDLMAAAFATEYARIGQVGSLVLTFISHALTMANATLKGVERVNDEEGKGVRLKLRYRFGITTVTYA